MNRVLEVNLELLSEQAITSALATPYWRVSVIEETSSTQSLIREKSPTPGDVIATEYQSAGRGRLDRSFEAKKSTALLFSFYIEPKISLDKYGFIPLIAGIATARSIQDLTNIKDFKCKWPNDILFDHLKVAGLLTEVCGDGIIVGIGINVSSDLADLPVPTATSIKLATGAIIDRNLLLATILNTFLTLISRFEEGAELTPEYLELCATIGKSVVAKLPGGVDIQGVATSIDASGALILASGQLITVGDLIHLRESK
jgi:BirA family biotin operon repressor/biotin-[acetyl-CoA-carboxylase] ligase